MGLLDEAIRDHLDLKRKRGADPTQLAHEEQEALGPAVRTAEPEAAQATAEPDEEVVAEAPPVEAPPAAEELAPEAHPEAQAAPVDEYAPPVQAPPSEPPPPADETLPAEAAPEPEAAPPDEPERAPGQETAPFDAEDLFAEEDVEVEEPGPQPGEDQDVLEETPEFLQETPEHDRLWFEQKPPRDFDFDG